MNPSQLSHLRTIDAHLAKLLDIAAKRTPGEWETSDNVVFALATDGYYMVTCDGPKTTIDQDPNNASFIASCANNAEAGWKVTRAAIEVILNCNEHSFPHMYAAVQVSQMAEFILTAFPLESLTPKLP